jgi:phage/plasmid-associated DNA primase|tara:strand:- start:79 stop:669 length:591 start_codon:yes stop_codon:yes gene_type:complete
MSLDDTTLLNLVENSINGYIYDIAKVVYYLYKDKYVCGKLKSKLWFHYENHKWKQTELGPYKELSTNILKLFEDYKNNKLNEENDKLLLDKTDALILKLKNVSFKENICRECLYLFYNADFIYSLDRNLNLICFENGVWNIRNKTFREGMKEDNISLSIGVNYDNDIDNLDYCINQFVQFRKKILVKRSPNHVFKI